MNFRNITATIICIIAMQSNYIQSAENDNSIFTALMQSITLVQEYFNPTSNDSAVPIVITPITFVDFMNRRNQLFDTLSKGVIAAQESFNKSRSWTDSYSLSAARSKLDNLDKKTFDEMMKLIEGGMSANGIDSQGKTALNYAQSYKDYITLRSAGADFQLVPFMYFHPEVTAIITIMLLIIICNLYEVGYFSYDRFIKYVKRIQSKMIRTMDDIRKIIYFDDDHDHDNNEPSEIYNVNDMQSHDDQGRTPLMNYLIDQEKALVQLRSDLKKLQNYDTQDKAAKIRYFEAIITYQALCTKTQAHIKMMIEQGSKLDEQDVYGKSLLNYCQTQDVYYYLRSAGAPFEVQPWIYFDSHKVTVAVLIISGFVAIVTAITYTNIKNRSHYQHHY